MRSWGGGDERRSAYTVAALADPTGPPRWTRGGVATVMGDTHGPRQMGGAAMVTVKNASGYDLDRIRGRPGGSPPSWLDKSPSAAFFPSI